MIVGYGWAAFYDDNQQGESIGLISHETPPCLGALHVPTQYKQGAGLETIPHQYIAYSEIKVL